MTRAALRAAIMLVALLSAGCASTFGARTVGHARFDYNTAINQSEGEQLLLNLVRLRYRDAPTFLAVSSVVTQYQYVGSASASSTINVGGGGDSEIGTGAALSYEERPTVSYMPVSGQAFARQLLSPIQPAALLLLSQEGWSIERLMICCMDRMNGVINAPSATGPTPASIPDNRAMRALATSLGRLQDANALNIVVTPQDAGLEAEFRFDADRIAQAGLDADRRAVERALRLASDRDSYRVTYTGVARGGDTLDLRGRSLLGIMFALSHTVQVPPDHVAAGLVTTSAATAGGPRDWNEVVDGRFRVHSADDRPEAAYVAVRYRDHWYYIADGDLESKTTFLLIRYLLSLQSAVAEGAGPLLTLQAGQ